ncbi:hypothetical protein C8R45DRAFT_218183 [Mycena sanguinolenta]|nr:hypothetical protein C8R45DRAFT_218183 [Mycena sanguinolenta]
MFLRFSIAVGSLSVYPELSALAVAKDLQTLGCQPVAVPPIDRNPRRFQPVSTTSKWETITTPSLQLNKHIELTVFLQDQKLCLIEDNVTLDTTYASSRKEAVMRLQPATQVD